MNLTILGAGAWGTALAISASQRHATRLWARDPAQVELMRSTRFNSAYLPGVELPASLDVTADFEAAVKHAYPAEHAATSDGLIVVATPMSGLEAVLRQLPARAGVFWLCKGVQQGTGWLGHEVARHVKSDSRVGVLSGPSFAIEVARGQPTALVAASSDESLSKQAVAALHGDALRIYTSNDPVGVEVGGAVKNVLAIATGIADGMNLGLNARAALITRGLAEMTRFGLALGARSETFMGLSGLGDLVLTATGDLSRNRRVGLMLAAHVPLAQILSELGHVAEGVYCASTMLGRARALRVDMPLTEAVVDVLECRVTPQEALQKLMGRGARAE